MPILPFQDLNRQGMDKPLVAMRAQETWVYCYCFVWTMQQLQKTCEVGFHKSWSSSAKPQCYYYRIPLNARKLQRILDWESNTPHHAKDLRSPFLLLLERSVVIQQFCTPNSLKVLVLVWLFTHLLGLLLHLLLDLQFLMKLLALEVIMPHLL